jgi:hypothetical protein
LLWSSFGLVAVLALLVITTRLGSGDHAGGDPGNKMLHATQTQLRDALPPGATHVSVDSIPTFWQGACSGDPNAHDGWSAEEVNLSFADAAPRATVVNAIDSALQGQGWRHQDTVLGPHQGPVAHWTLHRSNGPRISAFAYPTPFTTPAWLLTASWQPPGQAWTACP